MSLTTADQLTPQQIQRYQTRGFIHIPNVISKAEADPLDLTVGELLDHEIFPPL